MAILPNTLAVAATNAEAWWSEQFFGLNNEQRFVILLVAIGCFTGIVLGVSGIIYSAFDSAHRRRLEADLKREMLDRGMSAEEVAKVIEASPPPEDAAARVVHAWCSKRK